MKHLLYIFLFLSLLSCKTTKKTIATSTKVETVDTVVDTKIETTVNETEDLKEIITEITTEKQEVQYDSIKKEMVVTPVKTTTKVTETYNKKSKDVTEVKDVEEIKNEINLTDTLGYNRETVGQEVVSDLSKGVFEGITKGLFGDLFKMILLYIVIFVMIIAFIIVIRKHRKNGKGEEK